MLKLTKTIKKGIIDKVSLRMFPFPFDFLLYVQFTTAKAGGAFNIEYAVQQTALINKESSLFNVMTFDER